LDEGVSTFALSVFIESKGLSFSFISLQVVVFPFLETLPSAVGRVSDLNKTFGGKTGFSAGTSNPNSLPKDSRKSSATRRLRAILAPSLVFTGSTGLLLGGSSISSSESSEKIACNTQQLVNLEFILLKRNKTTSHSSYVLQTALKDFNQTYKARYLRIFLQHGSLLSKIHREELYSTKWILFYICFQ
jgi:hypothetical protein